MYILTKCLCYANIKLDTYHVWDKNEGFYVSNGVGTL